MQWKEKLTQPFDLYELSRIRPYLMGIATLWITFYHSKFLNLFQSALLTKTHLLGFFTRVEAIGNCGVDLFFFLSGLGLYFSYSRLLESDPHPVRTFYRRRYGRVVPPILIVTILTFGLIEVADLANWAGGVFLYGYFVPSLTRGNFWYLSATMVFYLIFPLLHRLLRGKREIRRVIGLLVMALAAIVLMSTFFSEYFYTHAILIMTRVPVFVLGAYAGKLALRHQKIPRWIPLLAVPVSLALLVLIADVPLPNYGRYLEFAVFIPCLVLAHGYVFSQCKKRHFWSKAVAVVGVYSMEIYLIYESIYNHAGEVFHQNLENTGLVYALTCFAATLFLAVLLKMVAAQLTKAFAAQGEQSIQKLG